MKPTTAVAILALVFVLLAVLVLGGTQLVESDRSLTELWVTETARDAVGNHHAPTAKRVGSETLVVVPVNANGGQQVGDCALYAFSADLEERWRTSVPPEACNIHTFGDPTVADLDGDGDDEVFVATAEKVVRAHDAKTGTELFRRELGGWGYAAPVVTDFTPHAGRELVVVDLNGGVFVFDANGTHLWHRKLSSVIAPIFVDDFDADGTPELAVGEGRNATLLEPDGTVAWRTRVGLSVTWLTVGQADGDDAIEVVAATIDGRVVVVDGRTGEIEWARTFSPLAAVYAFGDGDADGQAEVYAVAQDGTLRAIDASDGTVEWTTTLTTERVPMTPPPALGDLTGDGRPELVAVSQDGIVAVLDPKTGAVLDSHERDVPIWMRPTLADLDGDGADEILVIYSDGRVAAFSFSPERTIPVRPGAFL